jgi:hypothetical protein
MRNILGAKSGRPLYLRTLGLSVPSHRHYLSDVVVGQLNLGWVEWLMGFPLGWTKVKNPGPRGPGFGLPPEGALELTIRSIGVLE